MEETQEFYDLIKFFEGFHDGDKSIPHGQPELCPAGYWTIGWGHVIVGPTGKPLKGPNQKELAYKLFPSVTEADAQKLLEADTKSFSVSLEKLRAKYSLRLQQHEFNALLSFVYNCGIGALEEHGRPKSVLQALLKGNKVTVVQNMQRWNKVNGITSKGLLKRRKIESFYFLTGKIVKDAK